jgi:multicomponent Na+:H+ antiporter subunit F
MTEIFGVLVIAEVAVMAVLFIRLANGPTVSDRVVALNAISTQATLAVVLYAAFAGRTIYLDVGIWLGSFSYLGTLIWARLLEQGLL